MKKIRMFLEIGGFVVVGTTIEKMVLPETKKVLNINQKPQSNYKYTQTQEVKPKPSISIPITTRDSRSSYSYSIQNPPIPAIKLINAKKKKNYEKYWNEWSIWVKSRDVIYATGFWLNKYIVEKYYDASPHLRASAYWDMFEGKLLRLRFGSPEWKKNYFLNDIMREYDLYFKIT